MYKINQISPSIFHFKFKRKCDLFLSVMRIQEFMECQHNKIRGKKFSLEDLIVAYCELDKGEYNYFSEWSAFNFPDYIVRDFIKTMGKNLLDREKIILADIKKTLEYPSDNEHPASKSYYIATYTEHNDNAERDVKHEIAHGLYYAQSMYREIMNQLLDNNMFLVHMMSDELKAMKYCDSVLLDECQAYLATSSISELNDFGFVGITEDAVKPFREAYASFANAKQKRKKGKVCKEK